MATQLQGINTQFLPEFQVVDHLARDEERKDPIAEVTVERRWLERQLGPTAFKLYLYLLRTREGEKQLTLECQKRFAAKIKKPLRTTSRATKRLVDAGLLRNHDWAKASRKPLIWHEDRFRVLVRSVVGLVTQESAYLSHTCYQRIADLPQHGGARPGAGRKPSPNPKRKRTDKRVRPVVRDDLAVTLKPRSWCNAKQKREIAVRQGELDALASVSSSGGNQDGDPKSNTLKGSLISSPSENCEASPAKQAPPAVVNVPSAVSRRWEGWDEKETVDASPASLVAKTNLSPAGQEVSVLNAIDATGVNTSDPAHPFYVHPSALTFFDNVYELFKTPDTPEARARRAQREARERDQKLLAQMPADPRTVVPMVCVPYPKSLRAEMTDRELAARLAEVYTSVLWKRFHIRCWMNPAKIEKSKFYKKLVAVGRKMVEYGVNPMTWALWSFNIAPDYTRTQVPRLMWVFSVKRIESHHGWFLRDEPVRGKRFPMQPETVTELSFTYKQFKNDVFAGMSVEAAMGKHFPNGNYDRWVDYAKRVVAKEQREIDESIEDGVCVW